MPRELRISLGLFCLSMSLNLVGAVALSLKMRTIAEAGDQVRPLLRSLSLRNRNSLQVLTCHVLTLLGLLDVQK